MRFRTGIALLSTTALIAACGGDDDGGGESVSAGSYAKDICTATGDWVSGIQGLATDLQGSLPQGASPQEGKEALEKFLGDALDRTETYVSAVEDAGTPDVDGGEDAATEIQDAVNEARSIISKASDDAADLPTDSEQAFSREADELGNSTRDSLSAVGDAIGDPPEELSKAFQEEQACSQIGGAGS
jgi:vacuolar-type H+-ATPase subunit H